MTSPATNEGVRYQRAAEAVPRLGDLRLDEPFGGDGHSNRTRGSSSEWMTSVNR